MPYFEAQMLGGNLSRLLDHLTPRYFTFAMNGFVTGLPEGAIDTIVDHFQSAPAASWALAFDHYLHGAVCRVPETEMAFSLRQRGYSFRLSAFQERVRPTEACSAWVKSLHDALEQFSGGRIYLNYLSDQGELGVRSAFGANYQRLAALKKRYDPTNFFRLNPNVLPGVG